MKQDDFMPYSNPLEDLLDDYKSTLGKYFAITDWQAIDLMMAAAVAHFIPGEPIWLGIIGPSRSGKTEQIRAMQGHSATYSLDSMTAASLRGGFASRKRNVLKELDGKLFLVKDIAPLLTLRVDVKTEIFGLLRAVKDGEVKSAFGDSQGIYESKARFDWIFASTQHIDTQRVLESQLGERFIHIRWVPGKREEAAIAAANNNQWLNTLIRPQLSCDAHALLDLASIEAASDVELSDKDIKTIAEYAEKAAILRTHVPRDRKGELLAKPAPEFATDLSQSFTRIVKALMLLGFASFEPYLLRLVWDQMIPMRAEIFRAILDGNDETKEISQATGYSYNTVDTCCSDLKLLGVVEANALDRLSASSAMKGLNSK